jgi:hypothetical protein
MGWLSIINSVTNISRLGTFNDTNFCTAVPKTHLISFKNSFTCNKTQFGQHILVEQNSFVERNFGEIKFYGKPIDVGPPHEAILGRGDECAWIEIKKLDLVGVPCPRAKDRIGNNSGRHPISFLRPQASSGRSYEGRGDFVMRKNTRPPIFSI